MSSDLFRRMEEEVRRFGGELPIDAFLPELDAPSGEPPPTRPGEPAAARDMAPVVEDGTGSAGVEPGGKPRPPDQLSPFEDLEAEIQEFMNRDHLGVAIEDEDLQEFLDRGIDPNLDL